MIQALNARDNIRWIALVHDGIDLDNMEKAVT